MVGYRLLVLKKFCYIMQHIRAFLAILLSLTLISCAPSDPVPKPSTLFEVRHSSPVFGASNNAILAVKDYETRGIIYVQSQEQIFNNGTISGSKITYEMLMREAQKLGGTM
jgi:hypothetical protein